eukprot:jgi/Tetstr1/433283/TSEL_022571.t1
MAPPRTKFAAPLDCEPRNQQQQPHDVDSASEESNISCNDKLGELLILRAGRTGAPGPSAAGPVSELFRPDTAKTAGLRKKASITSKRKLVTPQGSATLKAPRVAGSLTRPRPGTLLHADSSEDEEVAELLLGMGSRPVLGCVSTPPASSAAASRASSPTKKAEPPRLPLTDDSLKTTKRKGGAQNGLETIGRCKCGKKISAAHPACKSELMLLCEKFQAVFGRAGAEEIQLNEAAVRLNVARRRLYDIINVLEAVEIISRTGKLTYQWRGMEHLPRLLERLVEEETAGTPAVRARKGHNQGSKNAGDQTDKPLTFSLWMLSRHFVRLLLSSAEPIPLADVSSMLVGEDAPRRAQTMVTVERRLYDIGSILSSIGLIKKTYSHGLSTPNYLNRNANHSPSEQGRAVRKATCSGIYKDSTRASPRAIRKMGGDSWTMRQAAVEGSYFRTESAQATRRHLERMVTEGRAGTEVMEALKRLGIQTGDELRARSSMPEHRLKFRYQQSEFPAISRSLVHDWKLGTQVSFGPARWAGGEASVWDVKAGKDLAQTPSKQATWAEELRARKIAKAQYESPVVAGYRWLPQFTPGRAFIWGTILSFWGTAVATTLVAKANGITADNIGEKLRLMGEPAKQALKDRLDPMREHWSATAPSTKGEFYKVHETPALFRELKSMYGR